MGELREQGLPFDGRLREGEDRFRRFGSDGPAYAIESVSGDLAHIRVLESGEELDYPMAAVLSDPQA